MVERQERPKNPSKDVEREGYFGLRPGVFLVEGSKRVALYDTNSGKIYSLNQEATNVVKGEDADLEFRSRLVALDLATFGQLDRVAVIEPEILKPTLQFAWLEITDSCNERCLHCYGNFSSESAAKTDNPLTYTEWEDVIRSLARNGCHQIQFIGGEPF